MRVHARLIAIGLAGMLPCSSAMGQQQKSQGTEKGNLFTRSVRVAGEMTEVTGEAMGTMAEGREDTLLGKGLKFGSRVQKAVGKAVQNAVDGKRGVGESVSTVTKAGVKAGTGTGDAGKTASSRQRHDEASSGQAAGKDIKRGSQKSESLFTGSLRLSGQLTKMTGDAMSDMSKGREGTLLGDGLALGGAVNQATGQVVEDAAGGDRGVVDTTRAVTKAGVKAVSAPR